MGCICSKGIPPEEQAEVQIAKSVSKSSRQLAVSSSRREEVPLAVHADVTVGSTRGRLSQALKPQENLVVTTTTPSLSSDGEKKPTLIIDRPRKVIVHHRRATVDFGANDAEPNLKIPSVPNVLEAELVAAGWPAWLAGVAGEAVRGWVPRRADSFEKLDKIGQGTYSTVYKARDLETGKVVALKKVRFVNMDPESVRFMAREIHILRRLDHPNIVKLEGLVTSKMSCSLYLVFEYMEHDLAGLAATPGIKFTEPQVKCYMQQLLSGLEHCHSRGILHRDIKGSNLLLDNNGTLKIADFGLATFFNPDRKQPLTSRVVTLWYRPPELLLGATEYGVTVDLWSTGCILAELLAGKPVMPGRTEVEQLHKIFKLCGSPSDDYWRKSKLPHATIFKPQRPYRRCVAETFKDFPPSALALLDVLLAIEPDSRGTASVALKSDFFTTMPLACDPASLPKYPPSKEFDAKLRDEEVRRQRAAALKGQGSESVMKGSRDSRGIQAPDTNKQVNPKSISGRYNALEDGGSRRNGFSQSGQLHPDAYGSSRGTRLKEDDLQNVSGRSNTMRRQNGQDLMTQRSYMPQAGAADSSSGLVSARTSAKSDNHREKSAHTHWPEYRSTYNQLGAVECSEKPEWRHQFLDRPSSSHKKEERIAAKESAIGYGTKKNRIHYSGPLMPPGGNIEDMLKEHERQIQQAVRKARLDKAKTNKYDVCWNSKKDHVFRLGSVVAKSGHLGP
ncbi:hypothetical protein Taro_049022 [Colocasia esculenta]|uniref:[RNA-polymerase]-subunit kinase n=1 Tax=Colocasia esculenta TaxID=4460 RepID=A0A843X9Q5_COLES|nr:hypothetical protein [Colocasia esculenta]